MKEIIRYVIGILVGFLLVIVLIAGVTMLLWNAVICNIFEVGQISFWQALIIAVCLRTIFVFLRA